MCAVRLQKRAYIYTATEPVEKVAHGVKLIVLRSRPRYADAGWLAACLSTYLPGQACFFFFSFCFM
jgi:hypothetical protein